MRPGRCGIRRPVTPPKSGRGKSYARIAEALGISTTTIKNTVYRIQDKLGVDSKQEVVVWSVRNGLLDDAMEGEDT